MSRGRLRASFIDPLERAEKGASMNAPAVFQIGQPFNPWKRFNGVFIPLGLLKHEGVSDRAKLFYGRLCLYAGKDGHCYAGRDKMAEDMGVSVATITRLLNELTRSRFIRPKRRGPHRTDVIEFLYHPALIQSEKTPVDVAEMRDQGTGDDVAEVQHQGNGMMSQICTDDVAKVHPDDVANSDGPYKEEKIQDQKIQRKELQADDSRAFRKPREKSPECGRLPSPIPKDGKPRNGLTPVGNIAATMPSIEDLQALTAVITAIRGERPPQSAVNAVVEALGDVPVPRCTKRLEGVHSRYWPGGHRAVNTWAWFTSFARNYAAEVHAQPRGAAGEDQCRHGRGVDDCPQCPERTGFNAALEAF